MPGRKDDDKRKRKAAAQMSQSLDKWCKPTTGESGQKTLKLDADVSPSSSDQNQEGHLAENDVDEAAASTPHPSTVPQVILDDVGKVIKATMSAEEIAQAVKSLTVSQKYHFLKRHFTPASDFTFPSRYLHKCQREFKIRYVKDYKWMVYSPHLDASFCVACAVMADNRGNKGAFVNTPFTKFHKLDEKAKVHQNNTYHHECMIAAQDLIHSVENPEQNINNRFVQEKQQNITRNRHILKSVAEVILFCGRQCIALRGDSEDIHVDTHDTTGNSGNFLAALQMVATHDEVLNEHLHGLGLNNRNAKYISPRIHNEMIDIIGHDIICKELISEIRAAQFFSILADEVTSHNAEQMALCLRFVDSNNDIREEFVDFVRLQRVTGEYVAQAITEKVHDLDLDITNVRGQGYDGAANMSSDNVGVQRRIKELSPKAVYVHCSGHCLNLVISHSCALPNIRNTIDKVKKCSLFFKCSPKREGLLESIIQNDIPESTNRKVLIDMCRTRWAARHDAYRHFYQAHLYIIMALENIAHGANRTLCTDVYKDAQWDFKSKGEAASLLAALTSFDFIITFLVMYQFLSHLSGITAKLQGRTVDIMSAYEDISEVKTTYLAIAADIDTQFGQVFSHAVRVANAVNVDPSMPRIVGRQTQRSNAPATTPEEYYRKNVAIPFIDHINTELQEQFSDLSVISSKILGLVPSVLCGENPPSIDDAVDEYKDDLPSPDLMHQELLRWKVKYTQKMEGNRPNSAAKALKECDQLMFPNIYTLLKIFCTIPATSCECERSASALRRLHTYNRASMTQERLSALALIHIHYTTEINLDKVVDMFSTKHPRRIEFGTLLKDN